MPPFIVQYSNMQELETAHPEIKRYRTVHIVKRNEQEATTLQALKDIGIEGRVYQVGSLIFKPEKFAKIKMRKVKP